MRERAPATAARLTVVMVLVGLLFAVTPQGSKK
jgi:hypothetical protein